MPYPSGLTRVIYNVQADLLCVGYAVTEPRLLRFRVVRFSQLCGTLSKYGCCELKVLVPAYDTPDTNYWHEPIEGEYLGYLYLPFLCVGRVAV